MSVKQASLFDQGINYNNVYLQALNKLNKSQKEAVIQIEGPVLVLAGPGTGKTQILAMRIGKILMESDTQPHNILCLTFTEAATIAMRNRLLEIIGPDAHRIHIHTFHSFCNQIIQENLGYFGNYKKLDLITDLERVELLYKILDDLPNDHILKKFKGNQKYEAKKLQNLFDLMKKENYSATDIYDKIDLYLKQKKLSDEFFAKRKVNVKSTGNVYLKGDFRDDKWAKEVARYDELKAASHLFDDYQNHLETIERYDYNDMILWVLKAFDQNEPLLAEYQERYQYFLVDEYQDTNRAQSMVLAKLIEYWQQPNVFVVGDDDQAIYKFQGANIANINQFREKYNPIEIILTENYRSSQNILDSSKTLISKNSSSIPKNLSSSGPYKNSKAFPVISYYQNMIQEQADLTQRIAELYRSGKNLNDMAVIYRKHAQAAEIAAVLEKKGIPINIKNKANILDDALIQIITKLLTYIQSEFEYANSAEVLLFEILHYHFFNISAYDIAKLSIFIRQASRNEKKYHWREVIANRDLLESLKLESVEKFLQLSNSLNKWISDIPNVTLQGLFENIINEGNILRSIFHSHNKSWLLQILDTFFKAIKEETKRNPKLHLKDFLLQLEKMQENDIRIPVNKILQSEKGIHFLSAHGAKGLEFNSVILLGCTSDIWDKSMRSNFTYRYPDNINEDSNNNEEDERRLFYVAMTRAKRHLNLSYSIQSENNKPKSQCRFIDEIKNEKELRPVLQQVTDETVSDFQYFNLLKKQKKIALIDPEMIEKRLKNYRLSVTALNKFIKCPLSFYFEVILEVPKARNQYMGFGRAIHRALQIFFIELNSDITNRCDQLIKFFNIAMQENRSHFTDKEFSQLTDYGQIILKQYYNNYLQNEQPSKNFKLEYTIQNAHYKDIPLKGILDKVEIHTDYVTVVDYKTGNFKNSADRLRLPTETKPQGGEYWRQIVFYKLLLDTDKRYNWNMRYGVIDFIEPDRKTKEFNRRLYEIHPEQIQILGDLIQESWQRIQNHEFDQFCDDKTCYWCNFVKNDYVFDQALEIVSEDLIQEF